MRIKRRLSIMHIVLLFFTLWLCSVSYAGDAEVLPKGRFRVDIETRFFLPADERFNPDGDVEDAATDFNRSLNANAFSALSLVETAFGLPAGSATLGDSVVTFDYSFNQLFVDLLYGVSKRLTVGVRIPYYWYKNEVSARVDTTNATVGKNAALNTLAPLAFPGTVPVTTDDIQNLLGDGLDINGDGTIDIPGFGIKPIKTWSDNGFGDLEVGFRWQYLRTKNWRLAYTGGVRFPTGQVDDPDNLVDFGLGSGAYTLLFYFNNDYIGIKNLVLNGTFKYELVLPDKQTLRVSDDVNNPIGLNKLEVDRDIGDRFEFEVSGKYTFIRVLSVSALYRYVFKLKDQVSGPGNLAFESLEDETDRTQHIVIASVSYTTIPLFIEKKFPLPLSIVISYRNRFAGTNNVLHTQYIGAELQLIF